MNMVLRTLGTGAADAKGLGVVAMEFFPEQGMGTSHF